MGKDGFEALKKILVKERKHLQKEIQNSNENSSFEVVQNPDSSDMAQSYDLRQRHLVFQSQEKKKLAKIEQALLRIEQDTYGKCAHCGEEIGVERLETLPFTEYCISCKEILDNQRKY